MTLDGVVEERRPWLWGGYARDPPSLREGVSHFGLPSLVISVGTLAPLPLGNGLALLLTGLA